MHRRMCVRSATGINMTVFYVLDKAALYGITMIFQVETELMNTSIRDVCACSYRRLFESFL